MKKILVIDDSDLVSRLLREALTNAGYDVEAAMDANQGYQAAIEYHPDLILLDVQLPDVTGFELIRVLKNRDDLSHIPIIMITGTAHRTEEKVKGFQLGADDYVMKPFEVPELLERIQAILRRSEPRPVQPVIEPEPVATIEAETSLSAEPADETPVLTPRDAFRMALIEPDAFPQHVSLPGISRIFLLASVSLTVIGLLLSAGGGLRPVPGALLVAALWGSLVAILVIASSIAGLPLGWREGASLVSLAGVPIIVKLGLGCLVAAITTLSPFCLTAGPALFAGAGQVLLRRIDFFEIWSGLLLGSLLRKRMAGDRKKALWLTLLVWVCAVLLAAAFDKWGTGV